MRSESDLSIRFISNIYGTHLTEILRRCDPEYTLFIIISKTFSMQETTTNAESARECFLSSARDRVHVAKHFVALNTVTKAVTTFGIDKAQFWDWMGRRTVCGVQLGSLSHSTSVMRTLSSCCTVHMGWTSISKRHHSTATSLSFLVS